MELTPTFNARNHSDSRSGYTTLRAVAQRHGRTIALLGALVGASFGGQVAWAQDASVNINLASPEVLSESLSGVGIAKAYRIVEYREAHGPFETVEELAEVKGIGNSTVERNRERIVLD